MSPTNNILTDLPNFKLRKKLINTYKRLNKSGLNRGTSGNCSVRIHSSPNFLITPSGTPTKLMTPSTIVEMSTNGNVLGCGNPSSEWRFHCDILKTRPEVNAIVHTHSVAATAISCLRKGIPAFHYMIAVSGGNSLRCADYEIFGSQALSVSILKAMENRKACLIANHGVIAVGKDLDEAYNIAEEIENLSMQYIFACQLGVPILLDRLQMEGVIEKFKSYGYKPNK